jgi:hypothetical protein
MRATGAGSAALVQQADDGLGSSQVAGAQQNDHAVTGALEHRHLAKLGDIVQAGIGAGVRGKNHPFFE